MIASPESPQALRQITPETRVRLIENGWQGTWAAFVEDNSHALDPIQFEDIRLSLVASGEALIGGGAAYQFTLVLSHG